MGNDSCWSYGQDQDTIDNHVNINNDTHGGDSKIIIIKVMMMTLIFWQWHW